jgi:GH24 family phage-related lysozyme (muramidase)
MQEKPQNLFSTKHWLSVMGIFYISTASPFITKVIDTGATRQDWLQFINTSVVALFAAGTKALDKNIYTPKYIPGRNKEDALPIVYAEPTQQIVQVVDNTAETVTHIVQNPVSTVASQITKDPVVNQVGSIVDSVPNPVNTVGKSSAGSSHEQKTTGLEAGIALIKEFEGCHLQAYPDPLTGGKPITIGWGNTCRLDGSPWVLGDSITQEEADSLLLDKINQEFLPSLQKIPTWSQMSDNQKSALLSFAWNLGASFYGTAGFATITNSLSDVKYFDSVPNALMLYVNPNTNVTEGLKRRRKAEGLLWSTPVTPNKKKTVHDFGFKQGDYHLVMSDVTEQMSAFDSDGKKLWTIPALAKGVNGEDYRYTGADTPPGIYKLGVVYRDIETGNLDPAYGWYTFDMEDLEGQETNNGRSGICLHGGGSRAENPQDPYQELLPTYGCVRVHNQDLRDRILPLYEQSTVYLSVHQ